LDFSAQRNKGSGTGDKEFQDVQSSGLTTINNTQVKKKLFCPSFYPTNSVKAIMDDNYREVSD